MHPAYARLLDLARAQAEATARGDLEAAVALLDEREHVLNGAPPPRATDRDAIGQVLRLDRAFSAAISIRMVELSNSAASGQHARVALSGYSPHRPPTALAIDAAG